MSKIVKFKKDHIAGFVKGDIRIVDDSLAESLIDDGYATEGTEKELDSYRTKIEKISEDQTNYESNKSEANSSTGECEDCGDNEPCEDCGDKKEDKVIAGLPEETKYHTLTEQDLEDHPEATEGMKAGDEVEEDAAGRLVIGDDYKFLLKGN